MEVKGIEPSTEGFSSALLKALKKAPALPVSYTPKTGVNRTIRFGKVKLIRVQFGMVGGGFQGEPLFLRSRKGSLATGSFCLKMTEPAEYLTRTSPHVSARSTESLTSGNVPGNPSYPA